MIEGILKAKKINFEKQYTFSDCVNDKGNKLRFDFSILGEDGRPICLIEYDGKQHFQSVEYFGGDESFIKRKMYDAIKDKYCESHGIPLIRLNYTLTKQEIIDILSNIKYP